MIKRIILLIKKLFLTINKVIKNFYCLRIGGLKPPALAGAL
jgi:hypothetical protein